MTLKQEYNELIAKINQAEKFLVKNEKSEKIFDYLAKFTKAMDKANELIRQIERELGRKMTSEEIRKGFEEG